MPQQCGDCAHDRQYSSVSARLFRSPVKGDQKGAPTQGTDRSEKKFSVRKATDRRGLLAFVYRRRPQLAAAAALLADQTHFARARIFCAASGWLRGQVVQVLQIANHGGQQ